jgi:hypothetical protein
MFGPTVGGSGMSDEDRKERRQRELTALAIAARRKRAQLAHALALEEQALATLQAAQRQLVKTTTQQKQALKVALKQHAPGFEEDDVAKRLARQAYAAQVVQLQQQANQQRAVLRTRLQAHQAQVATLVQARAELAAEEHRIEREQAVLEVEHTAKRHKRKRRQEVELMLLSGVH